MNSRITEILENLAILSQALHSDQENVNTIDILGEIKLLSAQLYLESDMEIITSTRPEELSIVEDETIENESEELFDEVPVFTFVRNEPEIQTIKMDEIGSVENNSEEDLQISQEIELEIIPETVPQFQIVQTTIEIENIPS